jgi:hypothetical protein
MTFNKLNRAIRTPAAALAAVLAFTCVLSGGASLALAADKVKANFIKGVWATADGCKMHAAIEAGGPKNVETTPEVLTEDGYQGWEGSCSFVSVKENGSGKWTVETACAEGAEEWQDTEAWELDGAAGRLKVTVNDQMTEFVRCDAGKGN